MVHHQWGRELGVVAAAVSVIQSARQGQCCLFIVSEEMVTSAGGDVKQDLQKKRKKKKKAQFRAGLSSTKKNLSHKKRKKMLKFLE